jgi:hypothetical protein
MYNIIAIPAAILFSAPVMGEESGDIQSLIPGKHISAVFFVANQTDV